MANVDEVRREGPVPAPAQPAVAIRNVAIGLRLSGVEWRIVAVVIASPRPLSAGRIARLLSLEYAHAKRSIRALTAWRVVQRSAGGIAFQPDYRLWERK